MEFSSRLKTTTKIVFAIGILFFAIAHTPLMNNSLRKKEQAAWKFFTSYFRTKPTIKPHRISFHLAANVAPLQHLIDSALDLCAAQGLNLKVKKFYHHGDQALIKNQIEESIAWKAEAIVSIGGLSAQSIHSILTKRGVDIPHIFSCVPDPVELGISTAKNYTGFTSTGLAEDPAGVTEAFFKSFLHVRPDAKKVIIMHSLTAVASQAMIAAMINEFAAHGIQAAGVFTATMDEVSRAANQFITRDIDAVIVLRDVVVLSAIQTVLKACRAHGVTAFVSDSNSVYDGAAAGCCVEEAELGLILGETIMKVVHNKVPAQEIPITYFSTADLCRTYVNQFEMHAQGMHNRKIYDLMVGEQKLEFIRRPKLQKTT